MSQTSQVKAYYGGFGKKKRGPTGTVLVILAVQEARIPPQPGKKSVNQGKEDSVNRDF